MLQFNEEITVNTTPERVFALYEDVTNWHPCLPQRDLANPTR